MMRWKEADQWLLNKCIGGVRGLWRFCSYLKGSAGEDLVDFWILTEKILSIDEMDVDVRDYYLSLLLVLKATHLQEGSRVITLCNMNIKSLLNLSIWHPNQSTTRREVLSHMQKVALFKIQSYWLPNFYTHAKMMMASEEECKGLMQEYETRLCSVCCSHIGGLPLHMSIKKSRHSPKRYSSRKAKRKMWQLLNPVIWPLEVDCSDKAPQDVSPPEMMDVQTSSWQTASSSKENMICYLEKDGLCAKRPGMKKKPKIQLHMDGLFENEFSTHLRTCTPIINHPSPLLIKKAIKQSLSFRYTHLALCADACAGNPFRDYLKKRGLKVETQLLDLWQDLEYFLGVLMSNRKNGNANFRHMLGNRICEIYLNEQMGPPLPLASQTIRGLKNLLPSGDVNPWIPKAQKEICQILSSWYDGFLNEEDYWFLTFTTQTRFVKARWHKAEFISKEDNILLFKRVQESLELSQALGNMKEMDSMQWQKVATESLRQGGSLQVELKSPVFLEDWSKMTFEELIYKNPKMAIEKISDDFKIYCEKAPSIDYTVEIVKRPRLAPSQRKTSFVKKNVPRKPSLRPRSVAEILLNPQHLDYFKEFLKERRAETPLQFLIAVQKISMETNEKLYKSALESITKTFLRSRTPPEEMLQCDAPIMREVAHMRHINTSTLLMLQTHVMRSLEEKWFREYQDLFPVRTVEAEPESQSTPRKPSKSTTHLQESQHFKIHQRHHSLPKRGWLKMVSFIKSFCKYRKYVADPIKREKFIDFLHVEMHNSKENFSASPTTSGRHTPAPLGGRGAEQENGEITLMRRRIYGHRVITVNFAVNDLYFFSEMEKFNDLVSSAHMLQINKAYNENDIILMRSKINIIMKLFLMSDVPPKLRVNITESQKEMILANIADNHLDRTVFHGAIMTIFPVIMYFWKRFCSLKASRSYFEYIGKKLKDGRSPPKSVLKYPPLSGGEHAILRFSLLRGVEWLRPQTRDAITTSVQNSSSSNLTQPSRLGMPVGPMGPSVPGNLPQPIQMQA